MVTAQGCLAIGATEVRLVFLWNVLRCCVLTFDVELDDIVELALVSFASHDGDCFV